MLAALLSVPSAPQDWDTWSFHHRDSHDRIRAKIVAEGGPQLADYQLFPISQQDLQGWLSRHAQAHIEMDSVLRLQSYDLEDVDLEDQKQKEAWIQLNYKSHSDAETRLNL